MIGLGLDTQMVDSKGKSMLHHAMDMYVINVNMNLVLTIIHHGGFTQSADKENATCLHYAAFHDDPRLLQVLLQAGFDVNARVQRRDQSSGVAAAQPVEETYNAAGGLTAFHAAASYGKAKALQALLDAGADDAICDEDGTNPIISAVSEREIPPYVDFWTAQWYYRGYEFLPEPEDHEAILECLDNRANLPKNHRDS